MPLIEIPDYIRQTILIDLAIKNPITSHETTAQETCLNNNSAPKNPIKPQNRKRHYAEFPLLIYSTKGRARFANKENDNDIEEFITENNICSFETFLNTVKQGSLEKLLQLNFVRNHFSLKDDHGNNALIWATYFDFKDIIEYLLKNKSPVTMWNHNNWRACEIAAHLGHQTAVELFIQHGGCEEIDEDDCGALFHARHMRHSGIIKLLEDKIRQNREEYELRRQHRVTVR